MRDPPAGHWRLNCSPPREVSRSSSHKNPNGHNFPLFPTNKKSKRQKVLIPKSSAATGEQAWSCLLSQQNYPDSKEINKGPPSVAKFAFNK